MLVIVFISFILFSFIPLLINTIKKMSEILKQEKVMNQLYKIGFNLDGSYYSYEERIFTMSKKGVLIEVDESGLVCGQSINEFLKSI
tara:strand:- start:59 stop:319 length:261 start_codon:yes stop_codon:yes gene_type:complete